ncbi:MAG: DUF1289 domain-containing protein [Pseudomonadota bacterium]|nr:DUF1289 domain-containing protein [Pseudomonadota bacterium]
MSEVAPAAAPASPCIRRCVLDDDLCCIGCYRTMDEIVRWATLSAAEQWAVVRRATDRADAQGGRPIDVKSR